MHNRLTILCVLFLPFCAAAQLPSYSFRTITINQGLSQNSVTDVATDDAGFLWLATQDGLNRYDGKEFMLFRKTFDDITTSAYSRLGKIIRGSNHCLWLITSGGKLEKFNLYNDSPVAVTRLPDGMKLPPVSCLHQDEKGALWIGTEKYGLFYCDTLSRTVVHYSKAARGPLHLNSDSIQHIFKSRGGQYWILTNQGINVVTPASARTERWLYEPSHPVSCSVMEEDGRGNQWVGTYGKGLYMKGAGGNNFNSFTGFDGQGAMPDNLVILAMRTDTQGRIWVGTFGEGLYIIDPGNRTVTNLRPDDRNPFSVGYKDILCIQPEKNGGMWIGTDGSGVSYYDKRLSAFSLLSKSTLPANVPIEQVRSVTTDVDGAIWIGTSASGLTWSPDVRNNQDYQRIMLAGNRNQRVVSLLADEKDTWVGVQDNGLLILDRKTKKVRAGFTPQAAGKYHLPDHTVWCMLPVDNNRAWLGTRNAGLCLFDKQAGVLRNFRHTTADANGIADNNIRAMIAINDSVICLGFEQKGIQFFNTRSSTFFLPGADKAFRSFGAEEPILKCLYYQPPLLWAGMLGKGIMVFDLLSGKTFNIHTDNGLPNNTVYSIVKDRQGDLWMSTNGGICRLHPPADLSAVNRSHFTLFTAQDGLQGNEFNTGAYHVDAQGILYFGGINGLNWFSPQKLSIAARPVKVVITQATINNEPWKGDTGITYKRVLKLPYYQNSLSFSFAALDFLSPGKFNYSYRLSSHDKHWIEAGNRNYAAYTNLPAGEYVFRVKASGQAVENEDTMPTLRIIITPPFWETWWFMALCALALGTVLYLFYRYRINQLIALQKVRNRIASDLHDDIGSTLTNISILSELSRQKLPQQEEAQVFLGRIAEEVNNSSQALDDIVWSINTDNDTLEQTAARMRRYAAEVFDGANIHYTLHLDEQFAHYKLNMEQRRDCFLLFKEVVNNIYKHACAKAVSIRLWLDRGQLFLTIEDDGKGFDTTQTTHRNGLKNMQQRVQRWEGSIDIRSAPGEGTRTTIRLEVY